MSNNELYPNISLTVKTPEVIELPNPDATISCPVKYKFFIFVEGLKFK